MTIIDLHTHTTASDGTCAPAALVARAHAAGISILGVTDHDTLDGLGAAAVAAAARGVTLVPGVEITAVHAGKDVHVLAYFCNPQDRDLQAFLAVGRRQRVERLEAILERLAALGVALDPAPLRAETQQAGGRAIGRPRIAAALMEAGVVATKTEAFERFLATGKPAFVPREGPSPQTVVQVASRAGGITSLAHPGTLRQDQIIPDLVDAGLTAIEAHHSDHSPDVRDHYLAVARRYRLAVSGGSDFHGEGTHHDQLGTSWLSEEDYTEFTGRRPVTS